jgi:hypothetical protein
MGISQSMLKDWETLLGVPGPFCSIHPSSTRP